MFAVIASGGKQYKVKEGQTITVEKLADTNGKVTFSDVLLIGGDNPVFGTPMVRGAKVEGSVVQHGKAEKITVIKYKAKVRYRRKRGHRQPFTKVKIDNIVA